MRNVPKKTVRSKVSSLGPLSDAIKEAGHRSLANRPPPMPQMWFIIQPETQEFFGGLKYRPKAGQPVHEQFVQEWSEGEEECKLALFPSEDAAWEAAKNTPGAVVRALNTN